MKITFQSPNFTGKYIKSVDILKNKQPTKASLIELTRRDINCIDDIAELWDTRITEMLSASMYQPLKGTVDQKVYAISTQDKNFEKVSPKKVLGIFEVTDRNDVYALEYLEVKPSQAYGKKKRTFTEVGKACIDFIKSKFKQKDVEIYALEDAIPFYEKMGCVRQPHTDSASWFLIPKHD